MYAKRNMSFRLFLLFAWKSLLLYAAHGTLTWLLYSYAGWTFLAIPFVPVGTIGTAVAFYVGFKNNSAYDRLWEARRIWGAITNASRAWGTWIMTWLAKENILDEQERKNVQRMLLYRHIAWVNSLRIRLRITTVWQENAYTQKMHLRATESHRKPLVEEVEAVGQFLSASEFAEIKTKQHHSNYLLQKQSESLVALKQKGLITEFEHSDLEKLIMEFYTQQGASERIKSFPFPRQYGAFSLIFVLIFILLLPFGLIGELAKIGAPWLVVPFTMLISWMFYTMEQIGDSSENPFENSINDIPMTAICRNIEIDLREMLGETELPERVMPQDGILM